MSDFTRWMLIMAARLEAIAAWKQACHYSWRYQCVAPLDYLRKPSSQFGFRLLSWVFLRECRSSLLTRIENELSYLLYEQGVRTAEDRPLPIRVSAAPKGWGWYVHSC